MDAAAAPKAAPVKKTDAGDIAPAAEDKEQKEILTAAEALTLNPPAAKADAETPKTKTAAEAVEETKTQKE
jgi:hypothetical protein